MKSPILLTLSLSLIAFPVGGVANDDCPDNFTCSHALTLVDAPKYNKETEHTDYVNPDAPKGGAVKLFQSGTFDSLNPYIMKGVSAAGINYLYDSLMADSLDEASVEYGLVAEEVQVRNDNGAVRFVIDDDAQFHDGHTMDAEDVVWTFNTLIEDGRPYYKAYYRDVEEVRALDENTVEFIFTTTTNRELPLILGQLPVLPKHYYEQDNVTFNETTLTAPLGSGPYKIAALEPGKWIRYERVEDYWADDHFLNEGRYNFGTIQFDYYRDDTVAIEAFKAGEFDLRQENVAKQWANAYDFAEVQSGEVIKEELPNANPTGMQAFVYNLRKPKFQNKDVREALAYTFDFEWTNKNIFFGAYTRTESYFSNSPMASSGTPSDAELTLLEPFREQVPDSVFTTEYQAPETKGDGNVRANLRKAKQLLEDAGYRIESGKLVNEAGEPLTLEFLLVSPTFERIVGPMIRNLERLGIDATIRTVDSAQYIKRVQQFDFDIIVHVFPQSTSPGNEQIDYWHSSKADMEGSRNIIGIKNPVVDALVDTLVSAKDRDELITAARALDRVLLHNHYVIPQHHYNKFRIAYWNRFGRPEVQPAYSIGFDTWWIEEEKAAHLEEKLGR